MTSEAYSRDEQRRRVAGQPGGGRDDLVRIAERVDLDHVIHFALANADGSGRESNQIVGDGDDLRGITGVGMGIAEGPAGRGPVNSVQVAGDIAAGGRNEGGIDLDLSGGQGPGPPAMAAHHDGAVQFALADQFGDEAVHPGLDSGDYAFADVGNDLGIDRMNRTGGDADVAQAHGIDLLDQHVQQHIPVAKGVVGGDVHAVLQLAHLDGGPQRGQQLAVAGAATHQGAGGPKHFRLPAPWIHVWVERTSPPHGRNLTSEAIFRHGSPHRKGRIRAGRRQRLRGGSGPRVPPRGRRPSFPSWR